MSSSRAAERKKSPTHGPTQRSSSRTQAGRSTEADGRRHDDLVITGCPPPPSTAMAITFQRGVSSENSKCATTIIIYDNPP
mmetsp:Transcript_7529/g.15557  ORF Transcript_7529/g.15557 Transcript_7529/m.15557 type:complete len:81 (+) Transcript_7529:1541-1783(+)